MSFTLGEYHQVVVLSLALCNADTALRELTKYRDTLCNTGGEAGRPVMPVVRHGI